MSENNIRKQQNYVRKQQNYVRNQQNNDVLLMLLIVQQLKIYKCKIRLKRQRILLFEHVNQYRREWMRLQNQSGYLLRLNLLRNFVKNINNQLYLLWRSVSSICGLGKRDQLKEISWIKQVPRECLIPIYVVLQVKMNHELMNQGWQICQIMKKVQRNNQKRLIACRDYQKNKSQSNKMHMINCFSQFFKITKNHDHIIFYLHNTQDKYNQQMKNKLKEVLWKQSACTVPFVSNTPIIDKARRFQLYSIYHKDDVNKPKKIFSEYEKPDILVLNFRRQIQAANNVNKYKQGFGSLKKQKKSLTNSQRTANPEVEGVTTRLYFVPESIEFRHDMYGNRSSLNGKYQIKDLVKSFDRKGFSLGRRIDFRKPRNFFPGPGTYFNKNQSQSVNLSCNLKNKTKTLPKSQMHFQSKNKQITQFKHSQEI